MAKQKQNADDSQLHWFWRLTTKWWFFPVFYISLSLITFFLSILFIKFNHPLSFAIETSLITLFMMPNGLVYLFLIFWKSLFPNSGLEWYFLIIAIVINLMFYLWFILCIIKCHIINIKKIKYLENK